MKYGKRVLVLVAVIFSMVVLLNNSCVLADSEYDEGETYGEYISDLEESDDDDDLLSGEVELAILFISVGFILVGIVIACYALMMKRDEKLLNDGGSKVDKDILDNLDKSKIEKDAFNIYKKLLDCWVKLNPEDIKNEVSPSFYEKFSNEIKDRKNLKEVIKNITLIDLDIVELKQADDRYAATIDVSFSCINYIENKYTGELLMGGRENAIREHSELEFSIDKKGKIILENKIIGMPYYSNKNLEANVKEKDKEKKRITKSENKVSDLEEKNVKEKAKEDTILDSEIKEKTFELYKKVCDGITNFDKKALRSSLTSELYDEKKSVLEDLKKADQRHIIKGIKLAKCDIKLAKQDNIKVELTVSQYDYVIDKDSNVVSGSKKRRKTEKYELTLLEKKDNEYVIASQDEVR